MKRSRFRRWLLWTVGLGSLALILFGLACYFLPRQMLTLDSGEVKADVMVVLGGGLHERPERAAELFKQNEAPKILVSGAGDCEATRQLLETNGVPSSVIVLECDSHTTLENAKFSIPLLRALGAKRVIIVTSWYHSRRALACFEHFAPDLKFYSRPSYFGYVPNEWFQKYQSGYVKVEFVKLAGYWVRYGVCPF